MKELTEKESVEVNGGGVIDWIIEQLKPEFPITNLFNQLSL